MTGVPTDSGADVDTVEAWAERYVLSKDLATKLAPDAPPSRWRDNGSEVRLTAPGRPPALDLVGKTKRSIPREQLHNPRKRAQLVHTFWHHELQAAELMCWAILAFPDTPQAFRRGLLGICLDEIRHMGLYVEHLTALGHHLGDFPVRDWFWTRVSTCASPREFVALMGMGLEGGNLDHTLRFADWFAAVGDEQGASIQRVVGDEEVAHVRFAIKWFEHFGANDDACTFDAWRQALIPPLTPAMMRGKELDRARREQAGFAADFLDRLAGFDG